ncbi:MAG: PQQ-binding-like beta-propeller repeat protein [Acidimicrobiales bacterium]
MTDGRNGRRHARRAAACAGVALSLAAAVVPGTSASAAPAVTQHSTRSAPAASLGDLTTYGYGNTRSDNDTVDPAISKLSEAPAWDDSLDAGVYGQPLVYDATVYVGTENDTIYAIGAKTGKVIWSLHVGTPASTSVIDSAPTLSSGCGDIDPLGITGTPVIDTATDEIFAAEETEVGGDNWQDIQHWLVAVSLVTHEELWHRQVDPPYGNQSSHYYIPAEQQRPALTFWDGRIYVEFGGLDGDCGQYHGYVVSVPVPGRGPLASYQVPTQREGAIWGTGGAFVSSSGDLYVATGNGSSNSVSTYDEGNSVVELSPALARLGYWAPSNWVQLNDNDWDLGSAGPVEVPGTSLLFVAGKPAGNGSFGYLMQVSHLGGIGKGAFTGPLCLGGGVFGADATEVTGAGGRSRTYVYVPCGSGTVAVEVDASAMSFKRVWSVSTGSPDGPPVVAGGLVWAVNWGASGLYGMSPSTGQVVLERSTGALEHFATPAVGDGTLFVPTQNGVEAWSTSG